MIVKFEKVSRFINSDIPLPSRKTAASAGYDFVVAEDTIIPSYTSVLNKMFQKGMIGKDMSGVQTLEEVAAFTKEYKTKPTLVSTGMKCSLNSNQYLELSIRSSSPLKYWLILANGVGIIDADYYNNPDNEGEIFFQLINLSPFDIILQKGETIGQGIIKHYDIIKNDSAAGSRTGGFGSTGV